MSDYLNLPTRTESEARADIRAKRDKEALRVAVAWREIIWNEPARDEDERIDRLTDVCTRMCEGDKASGDELAKRAIWA